VIVRPAYTLGGTGGGVASGADELRRIARRGLNASPVGQVLLEQSLHGFKEIEYEVMRDAGGNVITVCSMENLDPMGIHTGDSIVVAPCQTLSDADHQMLRSAALRIIAALGIEGGCNVQFALDPRSRRYYVIEVNPRVSRSSALASKATGYPIAKVAAKIAIGLRLDEIVNAVTGSTPACFEPTIDYVVLKIPRWPFDKFPQADRRLGTQMKATGEVMAIDRTLTGALHKGLAGLELAGDDLGRRGFEECGRDELLQRLERADDERLFVAAAALRAGLDIPTINRRSGIDPWFLHHIDQALRLQEQLRRFGVSRRRRLDRAAPLLRAAKEAGLADTTLGRLLGMTGDEVRGLRQGLGIRPVYKMVDTCAAEFPAKTPYFYSAYGEQPEARPPSDRTVIVLGAGPIRIGQGIEFDYCCVHAVWALQRLGCRAVMVNNNPETVSTDFDTADRLYVEPLTLERVLDVVDHERPVGVVVQCGGQTAVNLAGPLADRGVPVLGTSPGAIDLAEDRDKFHRLLVRLGMPQPDGGAAGDRAAALKVADRVGYPVLARPSYVLGGRAMEVVHSAAELEDYLTRTPLSPDHPMLIDHYLEGTEIEVDALADGEDALVVGVMEHLERAGVHSGDSIAVYPARVDQRHVAEAVAYTRRLARELGIRGLLNIQFVVAGGRTYVLELNPRASRTVPFLSKATGLPVVTHAVRLMLDATLADCGLEAGLLPPPGIVAVKAPVFSFAKLAEVDPAVGPEMKSTGEVMGLDEAIAPALAKALAGAGLRLPTKACDGERPALLASVADRDKPQALAVLRGFVDLGWRVCATPATAALLREGGVPVDEVPWTGPDGALDLALQRRFHLALVTPTLGRVPSRHGFALRRLLVESDTPCLTCLDTAEAVLTVLRESCGAGTWLPPSATCRTLLEYCAPRGPGGGGQSGATSSR